MPYTFLPQWGRPGSILSTLTDTVGLQYDLSVVRGATGTAASCVPFLFVVKLFAFMLEVGILFHGVGRDALVLI